MNKIFGLLSIMILLFTLVGCAKTEYIEVECATDEAVYVEVLPQETLDYIAELEMKVSDYEMTISLYTPNTFYYYVADEQVLHLAANLTLIAKGYGLYLPDWDYESDYLLHDVDDIVSSNTVKVGVTIDETILNERIAVLSTLLTEHGIVLP